MAQQIGILTAGGDSPGLNDAMRGLGKVAIRNHECVPVPLEEVAGNRKTVPFDHPWIVAARNLGVSLGDQ